MVLSEPLRILVVDDEPVSRALVRSALPGPQFEVQEAEDGEEALGRIAASPPDLVVCDYSMPGLDGVELVRRLKRHVVHRHIPVIMLTVHTSSEALVVGLEAGADDYVTKPFRTSELRTRVLAQLRRRERDLWADPLTRLPSGQAITRELERRIVRGDAFAALYADLDHFKPYVDRFGFVRAGNVVKQTGRMFHEALRDVAGDDIFVGHIAGDDFIAVCPAPLAPEACRRFIARFDRAAPDFYDPDDVQRGFIEGYDRDGKPRRFPLLSVSICVVDSRRHPVGSAATISELAFGGRARVKAQLGSAYLEV